MRAEKLWLLGVLVLLLAACAKPQFNSVDITGANYAKELALTDHTGKPRQLADYRGKVVALFFGFTQCPDVCPGTMQEFAQIKKLLGAQGNDLQVLFVTLDPERDTQAVLAQYVPTFDASFVGLFGSLEQTAATAKEFKIYYQKVEGKTPTSYTLEHSAGTYIFDRQGQVRLLVKPGMQAELVAADLKRLL